MRKGFFITLEGIEGAGKSSSVEVIAECLQRNQVDFIMTREPGGTEIAERIRGVILDHYQEKMCSDTEMLLYFAGRAQHLNQVILPALNQGKWVICDRFTDATYAYQGAGRGLCRERIAALESLVQQGIKPDYTILFDVTVQLGLSRIKSNRDLDRIEEEEEIFFEKVRNCYLDRAKQDPERFVHIEASEGLEQVAIKLAKIFQGIISKWK